MSLFLQRQQSYAMRDLDVINSTYFMITSLLIKSRYCGYTDLESVNLPDCALKLAYKNANYGIAICQTIEGALDKTTNMIQHESASHQRRQL